MQFSLCVTSDVHGKIERYAQLVAHMQRLKPDIILDNGDFLQGSLTTYYYDYIANDTHPQLALANSLPLDAAVYGNHEFNYSRTARLAMQQACRFPWLACNIGTEGTPYIMKNVRGVNVCIIGAVTAATPRWDEAQWTKDVPFESAVTAVKRTIAHVQQIEKPDYIIVAYHGGYSRCPHTGVYFAEDDEENEANALLAVDGIDLLITGHQHLHIDATHCTPASIQVGANGELVAYLQIDASTKRIDTTYYKSTRSDITTPAVAQWLQTPIGYTPYDYTYNGLLASRLYQQPFAQFLHEVQLQTTHADLSIVELGFQEKGGIRGTITNEHLLKSFSRPNKLVVLRVTGAHIYALLEQCASTFAINHAGDIDFHFAVYPNVAAPYLYYFIGGIHYELAIGAAKGARVQSVTYKGKPLCHTSMYTVAMNSYLATGADFKPFAECEVIYRSIDILPEIVRAFIVQHSPLSLYENGQFIIRK